MSILNTFYNATQIRHQSTPTCWIMLHGSTQKCQHSPSHCFEQDTNINAVHSIILGKANFNAVNFTKVWVDIWTKTITSTIAFEQIIKTYVFRH